MKSILFVDDESHVLDGLRRLMHPYRSEWQMTFTTSGTEALRLLEAGPPCDVIVTDMRMPGMSGAELLTQVSLLYPQIIRIVLSGMCDREQTLVSAVSAHQFLSKPCAAATLKGAVDRAVGIHATLGNDVLKGFISRLKSLPSLPAVYTELVQALRDPDAPVRKLGAIIAKDLAMTSKVLHLVNSALFGIRRPILDPTDACVYLGADTIQTLVLSLGVFSQFCRTGKFSVEDLQAHSVQTAALAKALAQSLQLEKSVVDETFLAGMLHDVGKLVLAMNFTAEYDQCIALADAEHLPIVEAESKAFGITHADAGMYLLRLWGLPDSIAQAVALHHQPSRSTDLSLGPLALVHVANVLAHDGENQAAVDFDMNYLSALRLEAKLPEWRALAGQIKAKEEAGS